MIATALLIATCCSHNQATPRPEMEHNTDMLAVLAIEIPQKGRLIFDYCCHIGLVSDDTVEQLPWQPEMQA